MNPIKPSVAFGAEADQAIAAIVDALRARENPLQDAAAVIIQAASVIALPRHLQFEAISCGLNPILWDAIDAMVDMSEREQERHLRSGGGR